MVAPPQKGRVILDREFISSELWLPYPSKVMLTSTSLRCGEGSSCISLQEISEGQRLAEAERGLGTAQSTVPVQEGPRAGLPNRLPLGDQHCSLECCLGQDTGVGTEPRENEWGH